jgi:ABC-type multidrug transport system ATPase subunit
MVINYYDNLNFTLPQAGIVGIIGPNGAGKSTIFRMIMGRKARCRRICYW